MPVKSRRGFGDAIQHTHTHPPAHFMGITNYYKKISIVGPKKSPKKYARWEASIMHMQTFLAG